MKTPNPTQINAGLLAESGLPPVSQMGFVVQDLESGTELYGSLLNIKKWYRPKITLCDYTYKGNPIDMSLEIAVGYSGKNQIELIQVSGPDDNIYYEINGRDGFGFHHFGVVVNNLEQSIETMERAGILPLQVGTLKYGGGGLTKVAYLDTMESAGFILELIETKAFGLNLGMPQWLVSLGRITGDIMPMKKWEKK